MRRLLSMEKQTKMLTILDSQKKDVLKLIDLRISHQALNNEEGKEYKIQELKELKGIMRSEL